jgi:ribonucleoside-triphosphate reductase (thioredoxin)
MDKFNFLEEISEFVFVSKYARFNPIAKRRETWDECVDRVECMHLGKFRKFDKDTLANIKWAFDQVRSKRITPSMRSMQFGGKAIIAHNSRIFNCAVRHIDSIRAFSESFYLLLCGCGVGFGISNHFLNRLPKLVNEKDKNGIVITYVIEDTIEGWSDSIESLLNCYFKNTAYTGRKIVFDYSRIRPEGAPLKVSGGKAPGYRGLKQAHIKIKKLLDNIIENNKQDRLRTINAYDILMHSADAVLSGGVRRSACSIIFDKNDQDMINAKTLFKVTKYNKFDFDPASNKYEGKVTVNGEKYEVILDKFEYDFLVKDNTISWVHIEPQRARSNNSVLLLRNSTTLVEFENIIEKTKQFGEPGFVWADHPHQLFNPCFEIGFIPVTEDGRCGVQFCNLSSINGSKIEKKQDLLTAAKAAAIIGTLQASYTQDMAYLSNVTKLLTEKEALLGVSITGFMDSPDLLLDPEILKEGAKVVIETNELWAKKLGISPAARCTCVKPEGTNSLVLMSASGAHPHHSRRYFRRIQCNKHEPAYQYFKSINPHMCEPGLWSATKTDDVVTFPLQINDKAIVKKDLSALDHLKYIMLIQKNWVCTGGTINNTSNITNNVSCTVQVGDDEWKDVINYIYKHRASFAAVSFLSKIGDKLYKQSPMEDITTEEDEKRWKYIIDKYRKVDYKNLKEEDDTTALMEVASCAGGKCELV